jgi:putative zinc- or iron-chelating protein
VPRSSGDEIQARAAEVRRDAASRLRSRDAAACGEVSRSVATALETEFAAQRAAGARIACAPGCAFCCHQRVGVFAHEAVALLEHVRTVLPCADAQEIERRIVANARTVDGLTPEQHRTANLRCALLVDGRCAAYEARPSACARYHSLSRSRCEHSFEHPESIGTPRNSRPALAELQELGNALDSGVEAALADAGLPPAKGELHQTLRALVEDPSAWRGLTRSSAP